jgi:4-hydroxysphinganine ceramide fatty acyl 2-hydroxylase
MKFESLTHVLHYATGMNMEVLIYKNKVVDVSEFKFKHPGGESSLDAFIGKDCTEAFDAVGSHLTKSAIKDLNFYAIGEVHTDADNKVIEENPPMNDDKIDCKKPILWQIWTANLTKEDYIQFIHDPKHMIDPPHAAMFDNAFLEYFSKTNWYMIPIVYLPLVFYYLNQALAVFNVNFVVMMFIFGLLLWTFSEYTLHRFVFHMDEGLPNHRFAFFAHFLLHGIHHAFPMDRYVKFIYCNLG